MANTIIQLKKSGLTGNVPSSLNYGELALNYADGKLFYKNSLGSIVNFSSGATTNSFSTINASSTLILASSATDTLSLAGNNGITITGNSTSKTVTVGLNASTFTSNVATYETITNATSGTYYPTIVSTTSGILQEYANNAYIFDVTNGRFGIGITPLYNLHVNGSFAATTKSFVIDHPTKPFKKLRYGSLEGPENGVYIRGRLDNEDTIELPEYWTKLVDEDSITINITPIGKSQNLYVSDISHNKIIISGSKNINCFYTVFAERSDVDKLEVEFY